MSITSIAASSPVGPSAHSTVSSLARANDPFSTYLQNAMQGEGQASAPPAGTSLDRLQQIKSQLDAPDLNLADLQRQAANALSEFRRTLAQLFDQAGVDMSHEIRLEADGAGGVTVAGGHPDADKIEDIFKSNPDLVAKFQSLAAAHKKLQAAENEPAEPAGFFRPVFGITMLGGEIKAQFR